MNCKTLEEIRADEIESFRRGGYQVIACDYGVQPLYRADPCGDAQDGSTRQHQLWALLERNNGHRAVHVSWVYERMDKCYVAGRAWESEGPYDRDVPASVVSKMRHDDEGADPYWRDALYRFWKAQDRMFRQLQNMI